MEFVQQASEEQNSEITEAPQMSDLPYPRQILKTGRYNRIKTGVRYAFVSDVMV
jgi:hypothetical protein